MNKLAKQLIELGYTNPDLRENLRPILASLEKVADDTRDFNKLLGDAEDAHEAGDKKKAKELLEKADALAEKLKKPALMNRLHKARGRMSSLQVKAFGMLKALPKGMPTIEELMRDHRLTETEAQQLSKALLDADDHTRNARAADAHLSLLDGLMEGFGVEPIRSEALGNDRYYGDIVGLYVNTGDTYNATVVYDTRDDEFYYTTYGDFVSAKGY